MFWITSAASRIRGVHGATSSASDDGDGDDVGAALRLQSPEPPGRERSVSQNL